MKHLIIENPTSIAWIYKSSPSPTECNFKIQQNFDKNNKRNYISNYNL